MVPRILAVEPRALEQNALRAFLQNAYEVVVASDIGTAKLLLGHQRFDAILLSCHDAADPSIQFCQSLKSEWRLGRTPILFLSEVSQIDVKIAIFSAGASDFISRPFEAEELRLRLVARIKETRAVDDGLTMDVFQIGDLKINRSLQKVHLQAENRETDIRLTPMEFRILYFLARHSEKMFTRDELMSAIWTNEVRVVEDNIYTHISSIRRKLGLYAGCIESVPRLGYRFVADKAVSVEGVKDAHRTNDTSIL